MRLLPGVQERLEQAVEAPQGPRIQPGRVDLPRISENVLVARTAEDLASLLDVLRTAPLSAIALCSAPGCAGDPRDTRSIESTHVSLAAWTAPSEGDGYVLRAVLDIREEGAVECLRGVLRLRVPFVFHDAKPSLFALWSLGLDPDIPLLYDTWVAAAAIHLGSHHPRSATHRPRDESERIEAEQELARQRDYLLSLVGQCEHYGLDHPFSTDYGDLDDAASRSGPASPLDQRTVERAAAGAEWVLRLYVAQQPNLLRWGLHAPLHQVEFPFVIPNARMEWRGVHVKEFDADKLRVAAASAVEHYAGRLREHRVDPPGSRNAFLHVMATAGLADHFSSGLSDFVLESSELLHPAVRLFRLHRRFRRLGSEVWPTGSDGRVHPVHAQLGAATGRNTCSAPNVVGIGRVLRPVVTAPDGRALVELDYSQIEVGVAAAEHGDDDLVRAYNSSDVYAEVAQRFYRDELSEEERALGPLDFKARRPDLRDRMKPVVLSLLYGAATQSVALRLGVTEQEFERRMPFSEVFPKLRVGLEEHGALGPARGYSTVASGLHRRIERSSPTGWARRAHRNTPIQGGAAVVFKMAIVDLDRHLRGTEAWIVLPLHDGVLIECPADDLDAVAEAAQRLMEDAVRFYYPELRPRVEVNKAHPECWNKDGHADSLERFLEDPDYRLDGKRRG